MTRTMAEIRADKESRNECRQCPDPAKWSPVLGRYLKLCARHAEEDAARNKRPRRKKGTRSVR